MLGDSATAKMKKSDMFEVGTFMENHVYIIFIYLIPSLKLTKFAHDKWMVGRRVFPFLVPGLLAGGENSVFSGSVTNLNLTCFSNWRFYPGTLEWYLKNPCFGGFTPIYPHFDTIFRDSF